MDVLSAMKVVEPVSSGSFMNGRKEGWAAARASHKLGQNFDLLGQAHMYNQKHWDPEKENQQVIELLRQLQKGICRSKGLRTPQRKTWLGQDQFINERKASLVIQGKGTGQLKENNEEVAGWGYQILGHSQGKHWSARDGTSFLEFCCRSLDLNETQFNKEKSWAFKKDWLSLDKR